MCIGDLMVLLIMMVIVIVVRVLVRCLVVKGWCYVSYYVMKRVGIDNGDYVYFRMRMMIYGYFNFWYRLRKDWLLVLEGVCGLRCEGMWIDLMWGGGVVDIGVFVGVDYVE